MNLDVPVLVKGDKIAIVAPAKSIAEEHVFFAKTFFEDAGFEVVVGTHCLGLHNYFSGTEEERIGDFQTALNDPDIKAIICARGGYGCVQIVDKVQWASLLRTPKWIVGFSDVTFFHQRAQVLGIESIHATMPLNFSENTKDSLDTLLKALMGEPYSINSDHDTYNKMGTVKGKLIGGNLSVLYSLIGTDDEVDYSGAILFIEDLSEYMYAIDRIFNSFRKAGILDKIKGLIVGGMTDIKDTEVPFGMNMEELVLSHFPFRNIPIAFNFPAGHINDNRALKLGAEVTLDVTKEGASLMFD